MTNKPLVSIITPCYNAEKFISETIESVIKQTYTEWEMIIVDDCSTDNSANIVKQYLCKDSRIKYFCTEKPSGSPTLPRNIGIQNAKGRYIAFLDADDIFMPTKLQHQIECFTKDNIGIVFSNYEKISYDGTRNNRVITAPKVVTYNKLLKSGYIGCCTMMYDQEKTGLLQFKKTGQEDYVFELSILKKGLIAVNTNTIEALYRIVPSSRSAQKIEMAKRQWKVLRDIEKLSFIKASYYFCHYAIKGVLKFIK
ncbi:MAG: glycosyltransferase family 2 protein [Alistipes sp.]|nr:glycosyltransferase family 2 protein [Alistipes sp.]